MKRFRKNIYTLIVCLIFFCVLGNSFPVFAEERINSKINTDEKSYNVELKYISPEEMEQLIAQSEMGIATCSNWFSDVVYFTLSRNSDGSAHAVFMKDGFLFDRCDLFGSIELYDSKGKCVARHFVIEKKLIKGVARVHDIHPTGKAFSYAKYVLTVSDGGEKITASGIKYPQ